MQLHKSDQYRQILPCSQAPGLLAAPDFFSPAEMRFGAMVASAAKYLPAVQESTRPGTEHGLILS